MAEKAPVKPLSRAALAKKLIRKGIQLSEKKIFADEDDLPKV